MISMKCLRSMLVVLGLLITTQAHAQSVYWIDTNFPTPMLGKADVDGSNPQQVPLAAGTLPEGLAFDAINGKLYWGEAAWTGANLNRFDDGFGAVSLVGGGSSLRGVAVDVVNSMLYWSSSNLVNGSAIHRASTGGAGAAAIVSLGSSANPRGVAVDPIGGRIYWADYDQNSIHSADLNGGSVATVLASGISTPWGLALDPVTSQLYFTEYTPGQIQKYQLPSGPLTTLVTSLANPTYLALDPISLKMYWTEAGAGAQKVQRANLDGSGLQNLGLPLATYGGIAVGPSVAVPVELSKFKVD